MSRNEKAVFSSDAITQQDTSKRHTYNAALIKEVSVALLAGQNWEKNGEGKDRNNDTPHLCPSLTCSPNLGKFPAAMWGESQQLHQMVINRNWNYKKSNYVIAKDQLQINSSLHINKGKYKMQAHAPLWMEWLAELKYCPHASGLKSSLGHGMHSREAMDRWAAMSPESVFRNIPESRFKCTAEEKLQEGRLALPFVSELWAFTAARGPPVSYRGLHFLFEFSSSDPEFSNRATGCNKRWVIS